jgi:ABC-type branched-subunit amino acid transport system ATPase component
MSVPARAADGATAGSEDPAPGRARTADVVGVAPLVQLVQVSKSFSPVRALHGVDVDLRSGEVLALVGENGAGKSTCVKLLGGVYRPDEGTVRIRGRSLELPGPAAARRLGIAVVHQQFVEIARALAEMAPVLILDEPTAALLATPTWSRSERRPNKQPRRSGETSSTPRLVRRPARPRSLSSTN